MEKFHRNPRSNFIKILGLALIYALLYKLPLLYFAPSGSGSPFFLASGLALALLLIGGKKYIWSIFLGALLAHLDGGLNIIGLIYLSLASVFGAMLGAWLLKNVAGFKNTFLTLPDFLKLAFYGGVLGCSLTALVGTTTLWYLGIFNSSNFFENMIFWWTGDMIGVLLIAPLILTWYKASIPQVENWRLAEIFLIINLTVLVGQIEFLGWFHESLGQLAKGYWIFLFIVWVALRLGIRGTAIVLLITATQAAIGAHLGVGFFADDSGSHFANLTSYILTLSVVGMALATYFSSYKATIDELRESQTRFQTIIEESPIGVSFARDGVTIDVNNVFMKMFGFDDKAEVVGQSLLNQIAPQCRAEVQDRNRRRTAGEQVESSYETIGLRKDGSQFPLFISAKRIQFKDGPITFGFQIDISHRKESEEKIKQLAFYDSLTGLPNRELLLNRLQNNVLNHY